MEQGGVSDFNYGQSDGGWKCACVCVCENVWGFFTTLFWCKKKINLYFKKNAFLDVISTKGTITFFTTLHT